MKSKYEFDFLRIIQIDASEIYYHFLKKKPLIIDNLADDFNKHFSELFTPNLDLLYLNSINKLKVKTLNDEQYSFDFINVSFEYALYLSKKGVQVFKRNKKKPDYSLKDMRDHLYKNGFEVNGEKYVRYKRSSGSARSGSCLFIKETLFKKMDKWSNTNLNKEDYNDNLVSFEAYKALSLSGLIDVIKLNPSNFLFIKDKEAILKDEKVERVFLDNNKLKVKEERCDISNNIWDGEGLLDKSIFDEHNYSDKGMMLLRNRFFKCCVFNTNLQEWFKANNIVDVKQLNGITFANDIKDIKAVVTESSLKYLKMLDGFNEVNIKKWCEAVSDENDESIFGIVKTDKPTRFFNGDMVETTYQFLNTIHLSDTKTRALMKPNFEYANKIRDIKNKPEYARLYIEGEIDIQSSFLYEEVMNYDDSEDVEEEESEETNYNYKNKVCRLLLDINRDITQTEMFRYYIYDEIISSLALKLYDGRVLVDGTNATLFGNPYELLLYIIGRYDEKSHFLNKDEVCSSFFNEGEKLVCSRAPHVTMGNILCAVNRRNVDIEKWFNLTREIIIVDAINNNIQYRLNGADYDSDMMLITNNKILYENAIEYYDTFLVPYPDFGSKKNKLEKLSDDKKENIALNLSKIDNALGDSNVGTIINYSQLLNSYYWNQENNSKPVDGIYEEIAKLAILSGAAIDSAKRSFPFSIKSELSKSAVFLKKLKLVTFDKSESIKPLFFYKISNKTSRIGDIENHIRNHMDERFKTTMDHIWFNTKTENICETRFKNPKTFSQIIKRGFDDSKRGGKQYKYVDKIIKGLKDLYLSVGASNIKKDNFEIVKRTFKQKVNIYAKKFEKSLSDEQIVRMTLIKLDKSKEDKDKQRGTYSNLYFLLFYLVYRIMGDNTERFLRDVFIRNKGVSKLRRTKQYIASLDFTLFDKYSYTTWN